MFNQIYSYLGSKLQSNYEKYEKKIKTTNVAMELKLFQKLICSFSILFKNQCSTMMLCLAKIDHLKTIL
jgi:hypothetical protein